MFKFRTILIIVAAIIVLAVIAVWGYWILREKFETTREGAPGAQTATTTLNAKPLATDVSYGNSVPAAVGAAESTASPTAQLEDADLSLARLAASYGETYGSYTTNDPYRNLKDLYDSMTLAMQQWADGVIAGGPPKGAFVTVVTRALATQMVSKDGAHAVFTLKTQRTVIKETTETQYLTLEVSLEKIGEAWKLAGASWKS